MIRYTTPVVEIRVKDVDLTGGYRIFVSLRQFNVLQTYEVTDATADDGDTVLTVRLTQTQTSEFREDRPVTVQANWIDQAGNRDATEQVTVDVMGNLLAKVVSYE